MASPEARAIQKCHVKLVNTIKISITSIAGDLYGEKLITDDVHAAMSLNGTAQEKAGILLGCVKTHVEIKPARVHEFTAVLRRNSGEEAAKALEDKIVECKFRTTDSKVDWGRLAIWDVGVTLDTPLLYSGEEGL